MKNTIILLISIATFIACAKQKAEQVSTIDSTLQVSVDSILQNKLSELDATIGQVIVMEVQTGEIKASVGSDSILQESGLVRTASLLAALETKAVKLSDTIDIADGVLVIGKDTLCDHNWHRGGYGKITVEQGFRLASNIANYKAVRKAFDNERAFAKALAKYGYQVKDTSLVYNTLGYGILTTPLQNLTFFNAASKTAIKQALEYSVSDGLAKPAQSDKVKVAGATGTIQLSNGEYAVEFCGYFPADNPKYSIIVSINKKGLPASGGLMAGDVFRQIVDYIVKIEYELLQLITQDALESAWGRSAQGKFNFGNLTTGAKWKGDYVRGNDHDAKGNPIKQKFRSYNSMDEYAADKLQFLKHLYDFDENDDINTFTAKLTGKNKGKRRYAEATDYADRVTAVFRSFKDGGVIKAQAGTIVADNTRVVKPIIQEIVPRTYQISEQPQFVQDNRSDWERQQSYEKAQTVYNQYMEDKKTEEGLRNLNGFLTFTDYATMGLGAGSLLFKGAKWAGKKAVGQVSKQIANSRNMGIVAPQFQQKGNDITERLFKFIGTHTEGEPLDISTLQGAYKLQAQKLQEAGVDLSRLSFQDLRNSMNRRMQEIINTAPTERFNMIVPDKKFERAHTIYDYNKTDGSQVVGRTKVLKENGDAYIENTENVSNNPNIHKVEERGLNSAILLANQTGLNGVISGRQLLSAPKTYKVWKHFPEKELINNNGMHQNINMVSENAPLKFVTEVDDMVGNSENALYYPFGNVFRLSKPSSLETKTKSVIFDPSIIDNNGKMNIDWNNSNIFKTIGFPLGVGLTQKGYE